MRKTLIAAMEEEQTIVQGGDEPENTDQDYLLSQEQLSEESYRQEIARILDLSDLENWVPATESSEALSLEGFSDNFKNFMIKMKEAILAMIEKIMQFWDKVFSKNDRIQNNVEKINKLLLTYDKKDENQPATEDMRHVSEHDLQLLSINGAFSGNLSTDLNNVGFFGEKLMNLSAKTLKNINKLVQETEQIVTNTHGMNDAQVIEFLRDISDNVVRDYESVFSNTEESKTKGLSFHTSDIFLGDRVFYFGAKEDEEKILTDVVAGMKNADTNHAADIKYKRLSYDEVRRITSRFEDFHDQNKTMLGLKSEFERISDRLVQAISHFNSKIQSESGDIHEMRAIHSLFKTMQRLISTVNKLPISYVNYTTELSDAYTHFVEVTAH